MRGRVGMQVVLIFGTDVASTRTASLQRFFGCVSLAPGLNLPTRARASRQVKVGALVCEE